MEEEEKQIDEEEEDLFEIIEELTTTGLSDLDEDYMKKLKTRCKESKEVLEEAFHTLLEQLGKQHAEIRYSAFQIISELFSRSGYFRDLVTRKLPRIFVLTIETEPNKHPSPLPSKVAKKLKLYTLKVFFRWYKEYAKSYRRIDLAFEFLRDMKKVNFSVLERKMIEEKKKEKEMKEKEEKHRKSKLEQIDIQMYDRFDDFQKNINELENCFELILPNIGKNTSENENLKKDEKDTEESDNEETKYENAETGFVGSETGIHNKNYSVTIEFSSQLEITEDETNTDLIKRLDELSDEVEQEIIIAKKWLRTLLKYKETDRTKIEKVRDLSNSLTSVRSKYLKMKIKRIRGTGDSDDDFIDVPEKVPVKMIDDSEKKETKIKKNKGKELKRKVPQSSSTIVSKSSSSASSSSSSFSSLSSSSSSSKTMIDKHHNIQSTCAKSKDRIAKPETNNLEESEESRKERLMKVAPVIPYGLDLEYWGKEVKPIASVKIDSQHRFWKTNEHVEEFVPPQLEAAMRTRVMSFPSKFEPVERKCGARMPSGKLCERMDRFKCPFHGKIIDRDEQGLPIDLELREKEDEKPDGEEINDVQQPSVSKENDVYTPTGMTPYLKGKKQRKSKKKKKIETPEERRKAREKARYARLSEISMKECGVTNRLEKKIFNKGAVNRVSQTLDANIRKKQFGKFGQQFNYL